MSKGISGKIEELVDFIDLTALTVPPTTTFREFQALIDAKEKNSRSTG